MKKTRRPEKASNKKAADTPADTVPGPKSNQVLVTFELGSTFEVDLLGQQVITVSASGKAASRPSRVRTPSKNFTRRKKQQLPKGVQPELLPPTDDPGQSPGWKPEKPTPSGQVGMNGKVPPGQGPVEWKPLAAPAMPATIQPVFRLPPPAVVAPSEPAAPAAATSPTAPAVATEVSATPVQQFPAMIAPAAVAPPTTIPGAAAFVGQPMMFVQPVPLVIQTMPVMVQPLASALVVQPGAAPALLTGEHPGERGPEDAEPLKRLLGRVLIVGAVLLFSMSTGLFGSSGQDLSGALFERLMAKTLGEHIGALFYLNHQMETVGVLLKQSLAIIVGLFGIRLTGFRAAAAPKLHAAT